MNVDMQLAVGGHKSVLSIQPDSYDGHPPVDAIVYNTRMRNFDPNICAVSTAIVLQDYMSESIIYQKSVQVHVADAIEEFMTGSKFRVNPVNQNPAAILGGPRRVLLGENNRVNASDVLFSLGDSHSFSSHATVQEIHISSNVSCFLPNDEMGFALSTIAAAVFVSADYAFGEICISNRYAEILGECEMSRYRDLLSSVNLKLCEKN